MNRLWIRMQHTGAKEKTRRESDRNELNMVVGENLVRLSSLEGVDLATYKAQVLPKLIEIIQLCKDPISQQYLLDCIIQVFTDEYHLQTLEKLLDTCATLHASVDVKTIIIALMDRLSRYAKTQRNEIEAVDKQINIFGLFKKNINRLLEDQGLVMDLKKLIELQVAFLRFSIETYPTRVDYVNAILELCVKILQLQPGKSITEDCLKSVVKLLVIPLDALTHSIFGMSHYPALMQYLSPPLLKTVAKKIALV